MSLNMNPTIGTPLFQTSPAGSYTGSTGLSPQQLNTMVMGGTPSATLPASSSGFGNVIGGLGDIFGGLMGAGQSILSSPDALMGLGGGLLTKEAYDRLSDIGNQAKREAMEIAERGQMESEFRPFTVTTPTGAMFTARMGGQPQPFTPTLSGPMPFTPTLSGPMPAPRITDQPSMGLPPSTDTAAKPTGRFVGQPVGMGQAIQPAVPDLQMQTVQINPNTGRPFASSREQMQYLLPDVNLSTGRQAYTPLVDAVQPPMAPAGEGLEIGMTLSPEEQALQQQLLGGAGGFFGQAMQPTVDREQTVFERIRAAQRPEEERQRLALEERLAAQGRLGASSAAFGGATPELMAQQTAIGEARNRAMLSAMQQAQAEQAQQAALGGQFLGAGYLPTQQLVAATQPGLIQQELAQQAQQFGTGLFGETALSGIEAQLLAEQARANLLGGIGSNVISGLINQQRAASAAPSSGGGSSLGGLFSTVAGGLGQVGQGIKDLLKI